MQIKRVKLRESICTIQKNVVPSQPEMKISTTFAANWGKE